LGNRAGADRNQSRANSISGAAMLARSFPRCLRLQSAVARQVVAIKIAEHHHSLGNDVITFHHAAVIVGNRNALRSLPARGAVAPCDRGGRTIGARIFLAESRVRSRTGCIGCSRRQEHCFSVARGLRHIPAGAHRRQHFPKRLEMLANRPFGRPQPADNRPDTQHKPG
jgi:hypothetical protein